MSRVCTGGIFLLLAVLALAGCGLGWSVSPFSQELIVSTSNISTDGVTINWTTEARATTQVEYGTDSNYGTETSEDFELVNDHKVEIQRGLKHNTEYHYRVLSTDIDGNKLVSDDHTFKTAELTTSSIVSSDITGGGALVSWSTNFPSLSQVEYGIDANYGSVTPQGTALSTQHEVGLSGLGPGTLYHYRVVSQDNSNNIVRSVDKTFTTLNTSSDLNINSLSVSNSQPSIGEPVLILSVLENKGDASLSNVEIRFFDNDVKLGSDVLDQVAPGSFNIRLYNLSFTSEGDHLIKIVIDPDNKVSETDENNNIRYVSFAVVSF